MADERAQHIQRVQEYLQLLLQQQLPTNPHVQTAERVNDNVPTSPLPVHQLLSPAHQQQIATTLVSSTFSPYPSTPTRTPRLPTFTSPSTTTSSDRTVTNYNRARLLSIRRNGIDGGGSSSSSSTPVPTSASASPSRPAKVPKLSISQKISFTFFILGNRNDDKTPDLEEENKLINLGLGPRTLETEKGGTFEDFSLDLKSLAERVGHPHVQFTIVYARGNRRGLPLLKFNDNPTAAGLKSLSKALGTTRWFLRPNYNLVEPEDEGTSSITTSATRSCSSVSESAKEKPKITVVVENVEDDRDHDICMPEPQTLKQLCQLQKTKSRTIIKIDSKLQSTLTAECILDIFRDETLNPFNEVTVRVADEQGTDIGGIKRDFFWKGFQTLKEGTVKGFPIFIGLENHLSISCVPDLVQDGTYKKLAVFLLHFANTTGYFCPGMSRPVFQILTNQQRLETTDFRDCPDEDDRNAAMTIAVLTGNKPVLREPEYISKAQVALEKHGIMEKIEQKSASLLLKKLFLSSIKSKQLPALKIVQEVVSNSIIGTFLNQFDCYLDVCPTKEKMNVTADAVIKRIENRNDSEMRTAVIRLSSYLHAITEHGHTISEFLIFLTGSPILCDETTIRLDLVEKGRLIKASSCIEALEIPDPISQEEFNAKMNLALGPDGEYFHCS